MSWETCALETNSFHRDLNNDQSRLAYTWSVVILNFILGHWDTDENVNLASK